LFFPPFVFPKQCGKQDEVPGVKTVPRSIPTATETASTAIGERQIPLPTARRRQLFGNGFESSMRHSGSGHCAAAQSSNRSESLLNGHFAVGSVLPVQGAPLPRAIACRAPEKERHHDRIGLPERMPAIRKERVPCAARVLAPPQARRPLAHRLDTTGRASSSAETADSVPRSWTQLAGTTKAATRF
jgi:hypothetical protein